MNIPVVHVQGGEVTGSIDEKVRHAVTKLSNLHLVSTARRAERVRRLGEDPRHGGHHRLPVDRHRRRGRGQSRARLRSVREIRRRGPDDRSVQGYLVVMQHPVTTEYEEARQQVEETLYAVKDVGLPVLWFWPNVDAGSDGTSKGIRVFREREKPRELSPVPEHVPRGLPAAAGALDGDRRQLQRRDPRVLVSRRAGGQHRLAAAGTRARRERDRRRPRPRQPSPRAIAEHVARRVPARIILYGDGKAGVRIADCPGDTPLTVEKRLTY